MNNPAIFPPKSYEPYQVRGAWLFVNKSSSYTWQKGTAKEQGHGGKSYQVFSLKHVYQFEENVGKISFNKSWGVSNPAVYSWEVLSPTKKIQCHGSVLRADCSILHSGLSHNHVFGFGRNIT